MAPVTKRIRVKFDPKKLKDLKRDPAVLAELRKVAFKLAKKANATLTQKQDYPDYWAAVKQLGPDPHAKVYTRSNHAKYSNAKHQTLTKLL